MSTAKSKAVKIKLFKMMVPPDVVYGRGKYSGYIDQQRLWRIKTNQQLRSYIKI